MGTESQIKQELADERRGLQQAVGDLREELGHAAERGKRIGTKVGAVVGAALAAKLLMKLARGQKNR